MMNFHTNPTVPAMPAAIAVANRLAVMEQNRKSVPPPKSVSSPYHQTIQMKVPGMPEEQEAPIVYCIVTPRTKRNK